MGSGVPASGGGSGGNQPDLTENVFASVAKHIGSGLGKLAENAITLGGAHAFEEGRKKQQETQAALRQQAEEMSNNGQTIPQEIIRGYTDAGGDASVMAGYTAKAHGIMANRAAAGEMLENLHKQGVINKDQYGFWALALNSGDPTAVTLAQEAIKQQGMMAGIQLRGQLAGGIEKSREGAAQQRVETQQQGAMERTKVQQEGAGAREQSREKTALMMKRIGEAGKASGLTAAQMKAAGSASDVVGAASGDPGAVKKLLGSGADAMTPEQAEPAFANANAKLAETKGMSFERMMVEGAFHLIKPDTAGYFMPSNAGKPSYGVGLPGLIENAAKNKTYGITPEIAANFRQKWAAALREPDPAKRSNALDEAIATIPDPDAQAAIYKQLQDMAEMVGNRTQAEGDEGDPAMSLLMGGDTDSGGAGGDTSDTAPSEKAADTDTGPGSGATLGDWETR